MTQTETYSPHGADLGPLQCVPFGANGYTLKDAPGIVRQVHVIGESWAGHAVGQSVLTHGEDQYVAYYDAGRVMTIAHRRLDSHEWAHVLLDSVLEWDSHNYVVMAVDQAGHLHVSGNMHVDPMVYFRTTVPGEIATLERVPVLLNPAIEGHATYPAFLTTPSGAMVFTFRDGSSGNGVNYYYLYDHESRTWSMLLDVPLFDGEGLRNAYAEPPVLGSDGFHHVSWVWRDTPDAATNSRVSYMRSRDLVHWETLGGDPITLPVRYGQAGVVVDDVPVQGGLLNGLHKVGFDAQGQPTIAIHKYDDVGGSQLFVARGAGGSWTIQQVTTWHGRWEFGGGGSLAHGIRLGRTVLLPDGWLRLDYEFRGVSGALVLDGTTLLPHAEVPVPQPYPAEVAAGAALDYPGITVRFASDDASVPGVHHVLRWEALAPNRDQPRLEWPQAQPLLLFSIGS